MSDNQSEPALAVICRKIFARNFLRHELIVDWNRTEPVFILPPHQQLGQFGARIFQAASA
jgi:hypothetical protein